MNIAYRTALQTSNDPSLASTPRPHRALRTILTEVCASGAPRQLVGVPVAQHGHGERLYAVHAHPLKLANRARSVLLLAVQLDSQLDSGLDSGLDSQLDSGLDSQLDSGLDGRRRNGAPRNARIEHMYERRLALARASLAIIREPSMHALLTEIAERARDLIGAHQAVTSLKMGQSWSQAINAVSLSDKYEAWRSQGALPHGGGLHAVMTDSNQSVRMSQADEPPPMHGWLAAPLMDSAGKNIGLIQLSESYGDEFTSEDQQLLIELARFASAAVDNARLFDRARTAHRQAEAANRAKDEFLAAVSHELRTPLNTIIGWSQMLLDGTLSAAQRRRAVETIDRNAQAQTRLIEDILDVSRIISGKLRLSVAPVDLIEIIRTVIDTIQPAVAVKELAISTTLDSDAGLIAGDGGRLNQVVSNLLMNAVKFTPRGGRIRVELQRIDSQVELRVIDNGQGIAAELLPHIFERFRQADDSASPRRHGGLGLGLSIVRHIVEQHGGAIEAHSAGVGQGATFIMRLPLSPMRKWPKAAPIARGELHDTGSDALCCPDIVQGLRVLVVDDDSDARDLLASVFARCGAQVTTAESALAALSEVQRDAYDVMLADIGMPEIDGYELIRRVRASPAGAGGQTPAVALTAHARLEDRTRALLEGFDIHVTKPIEPRELLAVVASVVRRYRSILRAF